MKLLLAVLLLVATTRSSSAQTRPTELTWAFPIHPGRLTLLCGDCNLTDFDPAGVDQLTLLAQSGDLKIQGVLSVSPQSSSLTAESCRAQEEQDKPLSKILKITGRSMLQSTSGVNIALLTVDVIPEPGSAIRAFVASGDLCGTLTFVVKEPHTLPSQHIKDILATLQFNPQAKTTFQEAFHFATALSTHDYDGAATSFQAALQLAETTNDPSRWRRTTAYRLALALVQASHLERARAVAQAAIARDPAYPLNYLNLARADALEGNSGPLQVHLQQAFDRRANTPPGEEFPDPAADDLIRLAKNDKDSWAFVTALSSRLKQIP